MAQARRYGQLALDGTTGTKGTQQHGRALPPQEGWRAEAHCHGRGLGPKGASSAALAMRPHPPRGEASKGNLQVDAATEKRLRLPRHWCEALVANACALERLPTRVTDRVVLFLLKQALPSQMPLLWPPTLGCLTSTRSAPAPASSRRESDFSRGREKLSARWDLDCFEVFAVLLFYRGTCAPCHCFACMLHLIKKPPHRCCAYSARITNAPDSRLPRSSVLWPRR